MITARRSALLAVAILAPALIIGAALLRKDRDSDAVENTPLAAALRRYGLDAPPAKPLPPASGYVGSQACTACHEGIATQYRSHPMFHSFAAVAEATPIESDANREVRPPGPRVYRVEKEGDRVFHHEIMLDGAGKPIYDQRVEVRYEIGSGARGRSYIIDRDGALFQSSIAWYSTEHKFDLAATYRPESHPRFERRVEAECLACHAGRIALADGKIDRRAEEFILEGGIGCERCHGPGQSHVDFHSADPPASSENDPIVNPARLDPPLREAVCNQCHLHGHADILRYGREAFDFRPGQMVDEQRSIFDEGTGVDASGATLSVTHVSQMRASACYRQSQGGLGCTSCHDAHSVPSVAERAAHYSNRCQSCHQERPCTLDAARQSAEPANGSCIHCHMPKLHASDIAHSAQTDHRVLRDPAARRYSESIRSELALVDDAESRLPAWEVDRARGLAMLDLAGRNRDERLLKNAAALLEPVAALLQDDVRSHDGLAQAAYSLGRHVEALRRWEHVVSIDPQNERALKLLARLFADRGDFQRGLPYAERLIAANPWAAPHHERHARLLKAADRLDEAIAAAGRSLELDPTQIELRVKLAEWLELAGRGAESIEQLETVGRMQAVAARQRAESAPDGSAAADLSPTPGASLQPPQSE